MVHGMMIAALWMLGPIWGGAAVAYTVVYKQPVDVRFPGGYSSQNAPNSFGDFLQAFDDFTLTKDASISEVEWEGSYSDVSIGGISRFKVTFWSDIAGLPGNALQTFDIAGNASEQFVGGGGNDFIEFHYATRLPSLFLASADTTYWLSVQPTLDFPPQWFWRDGTGGDNRSAERIGSDTSQVITDRAFSLSAPEPPTLALFATGSIVLLVATRRRPKRANEIPQPGEI
jgi:hypothetical protein